MIHAFGAVRFWDCVAQYQQDLGARAVELGLRTRPPVSGYWDPQTEAATMAALPAADAQRFPTEGFVAAVKLLEKLRYTAAFSACLQQAWAEARQAPGTSSSSSSSKWKWALAVGLGVAAAAGVVVLVSRRRRGGLGRLPLDRWTAMSCTEHCERKECAVGFLDGSDCECAGCIHEKPVKPQWWYVPKAKRRRR